MSWVGGERRSIARPKNSLAKDTNACTRARISITLLASHHREKPVLNNIISKKQGNINFVSDI